MVAASLFFYACSNKPIDYHPISEIREGPGLFSGEDGTFNIYKAGSDKNKRSAEGSQSDQKINQQEYQSFRDWKSNQDKNQDYQEFKAWQEWKAMQEKYQKENTQ